MSLPLTSVGPTADLLAHEIDRLHGPVTLVRRTGDLVEVLSVIRSGLARAVLVAEGATDFLSEAVDSLLDSGAVVAVIEGHDDDRLVALGATFVPADASAGEVVELLLEAQERAEVRKQQAADSGRASVGTPRGENPEDLSQGDLTVSGVLAPDGAETERSGSAVADEGISSQWDTEEGIAEHSGAGIAPVDPAVKDTAPSGVVVVWGPHGSPGRTTVAINLAAELAGAGHAVSLVDLDTWGPSVASLLGLLDESAGVALACRAADRNRLDLAALDRAAVRVDLGRCHIDVLTGLTRPDRWPELRAGSVRRLLAASRAPREGRQPIVVVDVGFSLEEDEELSFDSEAPRRNAATITALEEADLVLAVAAADVLGLPRAARALPTVIESTGAPVTLVINKVRKAAAGRSPRAAVREAWEAIGAPVPIGGYVSFDPVTLDRAALDGSVLAEAAASTTVRTEFRAVADTIVTALTGGDVDAPDEETIIGTSFGRRMSGWSRR